MNQNLIANVLSLTLFTISLFIAFRAFYLYLLSRRQRLFILGLSMTIISLTAIASYIGDNVLSPQFELVQVRQPDHQFPVYFIEPRSQFGPVFKEPDDLAYHRFATALNSIDTTCAH